MKIGKPEEVALCTSIEACISAPYLGYSEAGVKRRLGISRLTAKALQGIPSIELVDVEQPSQLKR